MNYRIAKKITVAYGMNPLSARYSAQQLRRARVRLARRDRKLERRAIRKSWLDLGVDLGAVVPSDIDQRTALTDVITSVLGKVFCKMDNGSEFIAALDSVSPEVRRLVGNAANAAAEIYMEKT